MSTTTTTQLRLGLLYKVHEDTDCDALLAAVRYLHAEHGVAALPDSIIELHIPRGMLLPSVRLPNGAWLRGLREVLAFLERSTGVRGLLRRGRDFARRCPDYRVKA